MPDVVITNARVFTNDAARPWAEAVAVKGERIVGIGTTAEMAGAAGANTRRIDAGGRVLVPGFNDARVDLPLDEVPTAASLSALDRSAVTQGVTSLQVVAGGPMRTLVDAARQAERQARWRLIRSPMDGERPHDEEPYLPPQPGRRLTANGVAWSALVPLNGRAPIDGDRLASVLGWAYGAEDPIVMAGEAAPWLNAMTRVGVSDVWRRRRPRYDIQRDGDHVSITTLASLGATVAWTPVGLRFPEPFQPLNHYPGTYVDAAVVLALGSGGTPDPASTIALATGVLGAGDGRPVTPEEAVRAMTWGSAYAEKAERDKGWLGIGTLADLAILSDDIFTLPAHRIASITSVLTMVGGAIVYDPGVLASAGSR